MTDAYVAPTPYNPLGDLQPFNDITDGPTGMFFSQTTGNVVSLFDYKTEKFTNYQVPTPESAPLGMNFFKGHLYFAELLGNKVCSCYSSIPTSSTHVFCADREA